MKFNWFSVAGVLALLSVSPSFAAQVSPTPGLGTVSAISIGTGASQTVFNDNINRMDCVVQNLSAADTYDITWDNSTPSSTNGVHLASGAVFNCANGVIVVTGPIKIVAPNTDPIYASETSIRGQ